MGPHESAPKRHLDCGSAVFAYTVAKAPNAFEWDGQPPKLILHGSFSPPDSAPKRNLDWFSRFRRLTNVTDRTDRERDRPTGTLSVARLLSLANTVTLRCGLRRVSLLTHLHSASLLPPGLPSRTFARTVSSELLGLVFPYFSPRESVGVCFYRRWFVCVCLSVCL